MAVAIGPFSATLFRRTDSIAAAFSTSPFVVLLSVFCARAPNSSHSICTPVASRIRRTAEETSGPMPSPGNNVTLCFIDASHLMRTRFACRKEPS